MLLSEYIETLERLAEDGYYSTTHAGMPDADYVGYAYKRHDQTLGGKGFPYDRNRDGDQWDIGVDRANAYHDVDHEPLTAKDKGRDERSGFEEAAGTPVNQSIGSKGGQQTGNPAGGMGGGWANRPTKPWDEDEMDDETLSVYGKDTLESVDRAGKVYAALMRLAGQELSRDTGEEDLDPMTDEDRDVLALPVPVETQAVLDQDPEPQDFEQEPGEDPTGHSSSDFDSFPSVLMQVAGSGFGNGLGKTNPSGRGFMQGWTEDFDILAAESIWRQLAAMLGLQ